MWFLGSMLIFQSVALYDNLSREGWNLYRNKSLPSTYTLKPLPFVQRLSRWIHYIGDKHSSHLEWGVLRMIIQIPTIRLMTILPKDYDKRTRDLNLSAKFLRRIASTKLSESRSDKLREMSEKGTNERCGWRRIIPGRLASSWTVTPIYKPGISAIWKGFGPTPILRGGIC